MLVNLGFINRSCIALAHRSTFSLPYDHILFLYLIMLLFLLYCNVVLHQIPLLLDCLVTPSNIYLNPFLPKGLPEKLTCVRSLFCRPNLNSFADYCLEQIFIYLHPLLSFHKKIAIIMPDEVLYVQAKKRSLTSQAR